MLKSVLSSRILVPAQAAAMPGGERDRMMIVHNLSGRFRKNDNGCCVENRPDTNGPKVQTLRVAISREFGTDGDVPVRANVVRLKRKDGGDGILMMFPEKKEDDRHFVIGGFDHWKHRSHVRIDENETTANILESSHGYGAWGSGVSFFAILKDGERIVSSKHSGKRSVIIVDDGQAKSYFLSEEEYVGFFGLDSYEVEEEL